MATLLNRLVPVLRRGARYWDVLLVAGLLTVWAGYWYSQRPQRQFALGLADVERKEWNSVRARAALLEKSAAHYPHAQLLWGIAEIQDGQLLAAIEDLHDATEHSQTRHLALAYTGEAWFRLKQFGRAEGPLLASLERLPNRTDTHRWLAALYYDTGAMENSLAHLRKTASLAPTDARPHRLMGLIYRDFEMFEQAAESYQESLARDPDQPDHEQVLLELAESQVRARKYAEALPTLAKCRSSERQQVLEAECQFALGNRQRAKQLLAEVLRESPNRPDALVSQGGVLLEEGNVPAAIEVLTRCIEADSLDYTARYRLAQAYQRSGDAVNADKHGKLAEELKQLREAFASLHHEAIAQPRNAETRYKLGQAALKLKRPDLAQSWFSAALALDPSHTAAATALQSFRASDDPRKSAAPNSPTPTAP